MPKTPIYFTVAGLSDVGVKRQNNEDAFGIWAARNLVVRKGLTAFGDGKLKGPILLVVADGMGGAEAGELASQYAVQQSDVFWKEQLSGKRVMDSETVVGLWRQLLDEIQVHLKMRALEEKTKGMATTFTGLLVIGGKGYWAQCGDSRLYRLRGGELTIETPDQSPVGKLFQMGEITEEQARRHPYKNLLDQCLGGDDDEPFLPEFGEIDIQLGDTYLLCSDGVMDGLWDKDIARHLDSVADIGAKLVINHLVEEAKDQSGKDNITGVLLRLSDIPLKKRSLFSKIKAFSFR